MNGAEASPLTEVSCVLWALAELVLGNEDDALKGIIQPLETTHLPSAGAALRRVSASRCLCQCSGRRKAEGPHQDPQS